MAIYWPSCVARSPLGRRASSKKAVLAGLFIYSRDPLFISLIVVVGFGMILTGSSYLRDRRAGYAAPARA